MSGDHDYPVSGADEWPPAHGYSSGNEYITFPKSAKISCL
jgi:hypothetical protein